MSVRRCIYREPPLERLHTYIGFCCREWVMAYGSPVIAFCGYCGERPTYLREDG